jgi:hypothetical protein
MSFTSWNFTIDILFKICITFKGVLPDEETIGSKLVEGK